MYRIIFCLLLTASAPTAALAGDVELTLGKFTARKCSVDPSFCASGENATQVVAAKNNGPPIAHLIIECAFMRGTDLLDPNARGVTFNVDTGKTVYLDVFSDKAAGADHAADCRVFYPPGR